MTHGKRIVAALIALLALTGCTVLGGGGDDDPVSNPTASAPSTDLTSFYRQTLRWADCGKDFRCTKLTVPLAYSRPSSGTLQLSVIRRAADSDERLGSLLVNPGGPGGSGVDYARDPGIVSSSVFKAYDIVGFDPRGVGTSQPVDCVDDAQLDALFAADATPDDQAEVDAIAADSAALGEGCQRRSPQLAPFLDSVSVARDMDIVRAVLGDERLNFLGKSYGTLLGALYAELFPDNVGRVILDGVLPNSLNGDELSHGQAVAFDLVLRRFVTWCIADAECPLPRDVDDGVARIQRFLDELDSKPLPGIGNRPLTQALGVFAILSHLYFPAIDWGVLALGLEAGFAGDGSVLLDMVDDRTDRNADGTFSSNSNEAFYAVSCLDRPGLGGVDHVRELAASWAKDAPVFGPPLAWGTLPCWEWPFTPVTGATSATRSAPLHAAGAGPILVVSTRYDSATPYQWGVQVADELDSGHLLTYEGDGHTGYRTGSGCVDKAVDAYLLNGTLPADAAACPAVPVGHDS